MIIIFIILTSRFSWDISQTEDLVKKGISLYCKSLALENNYGVVKG